MQELQGYRETSEKLKEQCGVKERTVAGYDAEIANADAGIADAEKKIEAMAEQLHAAQTESANAKLRVDSVAQRIATMKAMEEPFPKSRVSQSPSGASSCTLPCPASWSIV